MPCAVIFNSPVINSYEIASKSYIISCKGHTHTCSFKRSPSRVINCRIIPENRHICNIAAWRKTIRYSFCKSGFSMSCDVIHSRSSSCLKNGLTTQLFYWVISHSVSYKYGVFHCFTFFQLCNHLSLDKKISFSRDVSYRQ